ncbi:hypothetical protein [Thiolapillus sp.]
MLRVRLVSFYMGWCMRLGAAPWKYFQLNAPWFNSERHLFSKREMDEFIPSEWRLRQTPLNKTGLPRRWPVFLKPEWGQNSRGVVLARNASDWEKLSLAMSQQKVPYLVQEAAPGKREFELFYIRSGTNQEQFAILSVTETLNHSDQEWPVNSILNPDTRHTTLNLTKEQQQQLWNHMARLPDFRIARVGLRADSMQALLAGRFHIIEINLFVPMPLTLLDQSIPLKQRHDFISKAMKALAELTLNLPGKKKRKNIFWPMLLLNYRIRS